MYPQIDIYITIILDYNLKRKGFHMKNTLLGNTGLSVSPVGMGVLPIGPNQRNLPLKEGAQVIKYALGRGINFIDTAQYYRTYPYIREAMRQLKDESSLASRPVICSKCLGADYESMKDAVEEARDALDIDVIDIFLLHEVRSGQFAERAGAWEYLNKAKTEGLVRAIGVSTHNVDVVREMASVDECDVVFPLVNYAGLGIRNGEGPGTADEMMEAISACHDARKGIFSMKVFGGGNLTGTYQKALDYVFSKKQIDSVMVGFSSESEIDDMIEYLEGNMPKEYNPDVSAKRMWIEESDCEGCGNCMKACQSQAIFYNERGLAQIREDICLTCGYCAAACPVRAIIMV